MQNPLSLLSHDGKKALANARRIAEQHNLPSVDSEALLLAALQAPASPARDALAALNVKVENMVARLSATIKLDARQADARSGEAQLSTDSVVILDEARAEAELHGVNFIDARLLILGMLRHSDSKAGQFLAQYGVTAEQFRERAKIKEAPPARLPNFSLPKIGSAVYGVSPIFIILLAFSACAGIFTYLGIGNVRLFMFFFVMGGWVISVCLHEFGHALIAYWGGDEDVAHQGYLTLDPLKYTHPFLSIVLPVIIMLMGGIGFPGGAVYINTHALKSPTFRSLVSAAGPFANLICAIVLSIPFTALGFFLEFKHAEFFEALGFLALLQITAMSLNLLPIPGLDGFGIVEPFLPSELVNGLNFIRPFGFILLFTLLSVDSPIQRAFWDGIWNVMTFINYDMAYYANEGVRLFIAWRR